MKKFVTRSSSETSQLGQALARQLSGGALICLEGDLGAGKTTFTQGLLKELGIKGPYTSPTFIILKHYQLKDKNVYHIDAYRIGPKDLLALGWKEIIADPKNIIIIEWSDRVKKILPQNCLKIKCRWLNKESRELIFSQAPLLPKLASHVKNNNALN